MWLHSHPWTPSIINPLAVLIVVYIFTVACSPVSNLSIALTCLHPNPQLGLPDYISPSF